MCKQIICAALVLAFATAANGAIAYAPNNLTRPSPFNGPDDLVMFDTSNPENFVVVGSMGVADIGFGAMDFDADGNLWAYASQYKPTGGAASGLYSVNIETGQATIQGTASTQSLDDLAFNPVDGRMYGIRSQFTATRLYTIDLETGATSLVGSFSGLDGDMEQVIGLAIDSHGDFYLQDVGQDKIYKGSGLSVSELYTIPQDTTFQQGLGIDWSRGDTGYHGSVGQGEFPNYFSTINVFAADGSSYRVGGDFGPNEMIDGYGIPLVEPGDIAIMPVPEPSCALLLMLGVALYRNRR